MSPKKQTLKSTKSATSKSKTPNVWTDEEKAAMREIAKERKAEERINMDRAAGEKSSAREDRPDEGFGSRPGQADP